MTRPSRPPRALPVLALLALAACGGDETAFTGAAAVPLDGVWTGTAQLARGGARTCPAPTPVVLTIAGGAVRGEVRDRRDRNAVVARFDAVLDPDGRIVARAWYDATSNDLSVSYDGARFSGTITNPLECLFNLRLSRG